MKLMIENQQAKSDLDKPSIKIQIHFREEEVEYFKRFITENISFDNRYYLPFNDVYSRYKNNLTNNGLKNWIVPKNKFWFLFDYQFIPETITVKKQNRQVVIYKGIKFRFTS